MKRQLFADGGAPMPTPTPTPTPATPDASVEDDSDDQATAAPALAPTPNPGTPSLDQTIDGTPAAPTAPSAPDQAAAAQPPAPQAQTQAQTAAYQPEPSPATPQQQAEATTNHIVQTMGADDEAFYNAARNQQIKPETLQSLYGKEDTTGKIGTLFGLLLSGAGSGLAHQSNAVLDMMNKQIENDFNAQKTNAENKMNFYKLAMEHQLQPYRVQEMQARNALMDAQKRGAEAEIPLRKAEYQRAQAETKKAQTETEGLATANAINKGTLGVLSSLNQTVDRMPPGPAKAAAQSSLNGTIIPAAVQANGQRTAQAAQQYSAQQIANGMADEPTFQNYTQALDRSVDPRLQKIGADIESRHVPGVQGAASMPLNDKDRATIESGANLQRSLKNYKDWAATHSGDLNPKDRAYGQALAAQVSSAYRDAIGGGVYKSGEQDFINKVIDPNPTKFFNNLRGVTSKLDATINESRAQLDTFMKSKGFNGYQPQGEQGQQQSSAPQQSQYQDGQIYQSGGKQYRYNANTHKMIPLSQAAK